MPQRRVSRYPRAQQRRHRRRIQIAGNLEDEGLIDDDLLRVPAVSNTAQMFVFAVVSEGRKLLAILFQSTLAVDTDTARIHHAADSSQIPGLELAHVLPDRRHAPDDLVSRHHGIDRVVPFVTRLMQIGMTYAAKQDVDRDIVILHLPSRNPKRRERHGRALGRVSFRLVHIPYDAGRVG
jgi:hypothetical protein